VSLKSEVDRLAQPPATFAVFLAGHEDHTADIYTSGRKMRVSVSPDVALEELSPGKEVMVNEAMNVGQGPAVRRGRRGRAAQGDAGGWRPRAGDRTWR
jgi:ATP-dependent 26S proteasome regulatory subunit